MANKVVKWKDGQIVVRPALVEDEIAASRIGRELGDIYPPGTIGMFAHFAQLCAQTISSEGLPFQPENMRSGPRSELRSGYEDFLKLPKAMRLKWQEAVDAAENVTDYALGPDPLPSDAPKN